MLSIPEYPRAARVFAYFEEITKIPRGSGNTAKIADYLERFAKEHSLVCLRDGRDNVVIRKPGTAGYENHPGVVFQGHTDIVAEKTADCGKDLSRDGLEIYRDGDFLRAKGTTLGGDDGVAIAYALAILETNDIPHPPFEALFTSDEEVGLLGATAMDGGMVNGRVMINIDSDEEGVFTVGCAGGLRLDLTLPVSREKSNKVATRVKISGCTGGHSGAEIHLGRANANKLLAELLYKVGGLSLVSMAGGNMDNAIPRAAEAVVLSDGDITEKIAALGAKMKEEHKAADPAMEITAEATQNDLPAIGEAGTAKLLSLLVSLPNGVQAMSAAMPGLVETSLNLGILKLDEDALRFSYSIRSSVERAKKELCDRVVAAVTAAGGSFGERGAYPAWEYRENSPLRDTMCKVYRELYKKDAKVTVIHAGLECGILSSKLPGLDCVSMGPDNFDIHTTEEHLSIPSTARVYDCLLAVLAAL